MTNTNEKSFQERDRLERKPLVDKICYLVDNLPKDEHFCLALDGPWGSGKTFVLNMLEEGFSRHEEYFVVKYDAWKNSFYHDPLIAILYSIIDSLKEKLDLAEDKKRKCERVLKKLFKDAKTVWNSEIKDRLLQVKELRTAYMGYCFVRYLYELTKTAKFDLHKHQKFEDFVSYQSLLNDIQKVLNEFTGYQFCNGKQTKLIILVDEIDRCLPNEQLVILERLHHLFDIKNCAVIVAINKSTTASAFHTQQGCDGKEYLKKIFQHNFYVEPLWRVLLKRRMVEIIKMYYEGKNAKDILDDKEIDYVYEHILIACDETRPTVSSKNFEFDNRSINEYLQRVQQVLFNQSVEQMNYIYLWVICLMMFHRIFDKRTFTEYYIGKENDYEDVIKLNRSKWGDPLCNTISVYNMQGERISYRIYADIKHNGINFIHNYIKVRKTGYVSTINSRFDATTIGCELDKSIVEHILDEINKYSE